MNFCEVSKDVFVDKGYDESTESEVKDLIIVVDGNEVEKS